MLEKSNQIGGTPTVHITTYALAECPSLLVLLQEEEDG